MAVRALTAEPAPGKAHIGPNAVTQVIAALREREGETVCADVLETAGLSRYAAAPPVAMIPQAEAADLQRAVRVLLAPEAAGAILRDAGRRTGDYLLANRIPRPAQFVLRLLPASIAMRALLAAIRAHAWTFAGSGRFRAMPGNPAVIEIAGCPLCQGQQSSAPACDTYTAVFERLFQVLVSRRIHVVETACEAMGAPACRFELSWSRGVLAERATSRSTCSAQTAHGAGPAVPR